MRTLLLPISIFAACALLWAAKPILVPFLIAALLAQLLVPVAKRLERFVPRPVATALTVLAAVSCVAAVATLIGNQLASLESMLPQIATRFNTIVGRTGYAAMVKQGLNGAVGAGGEAALSAVSFTLATLVEIGLIIILTFLMLLYRGHILGNLRRLDRRNATPAIAIALQRVLEIGQSYVAGVGLVVCLVSLVDTFGLLLVGAPFAVIFGVLGGLSVLVPYVGIAMLAPAAATVAWLTTGSTSAAGGVLAVYVVVHFIEGHIISPFVVGGKVNLNPLATILAVLLGERMWGAAGMVLFIPLLSIAKLGIEGLPGAEPFARLLGPVHKPRANPNEPDGQPHWIKVAGNVAVRILPYSTRWRRAPGATAPGAAAPSPP